VAYIWASRVPNIPVPTVKIGAADFIPATQKTPLPVDVPEPGWKFLDRARAWALVSKDKKVPVPVPVVKLGNQHALELDLTKANLPPGDYDLTGLWDWTPLRISGAVHVMPLSDFQTAHVDPASQDHLLAKSGKTPVTVTGSDFEFTEKVELKKLHGGERSIPAAERAARWTAGSDGCPDRHREAGFRLVRIVDFAAGRKKPPGGIQGSAESA
jgi:hypothetical protein